MILFLFLILVVLMERFKELPYLLPCWCCRLGKFGASNDALDINALNSAYGCDCYC